MAKSTRKRPPQKPYATFPLFAHQNGQWAKKIRGTLFYFGPWGDWEAALDRYKAQADDLHAGRHPTTPADPDTVTIADLANAWLTWQESKRDNGDLAGRTFEDYHREAARFAEHFGRTRPVASIRPADLGVYRSAIARGINPVSLGNRMRPIRMMLAWGYENEVLDKPVRLGTQFRLPTQKALRVEKNSKAAKLFTRDETLALLDAAYQPLRAMMLLALNGALGNSDIARMDWSRIEDGWVVYPRPKTGVQRRFPLWPVTVKALDEWRERRPDPANPDDADRVFLNRHRKNYCDGDGEGQAIGDYFKVCRDRAGIAGNGRGFYALRHTHRTVADRANDTTAARIIMGHVDPSIDEVYRHWQDDSETNDRVRKVANAVHKWLYGRPAWRKKRRAGAAS